MNIVAGLIIGGVAVMFVFCAGVMGLLGLSGDKKPQEPAPAPVVNNAPRIESEPSRPQPVRSQEPGPEVKERDSDPPIDLQNTPAAKQWREKWLADQEARAVALSKKIGEIEEHLAEREATYKRRMEAGSLDGATKKEIDKLKQDLDDALHELHRLDAAIAAGPPPYVPPETPHVAAKPAAPSQPRPAPSVGSSGGTVQVRGYTRKDGTVVAPYTRSAPRK